MNVCTNQRAIISRKTHKLKLMFNSTSYPLFASDIVSSWFVPNWLNHLCQPLQIIIVETSPFKTSKIPLMAHEIKCTRVSNNGDYSVNS